MTETRDLKFTIRLTTEEWNNLERYANNEGKSLEQYLGQYVNVGVLTALREGYVIDAFKSVNDGSKIHNPSNCDSL